MSTILTNERVTEIRESFPAWCDHCHVTLYDWQREAFYEATRRENGRFVHPLSGVSVPRGNGKSFAGAMVGAWGLFRQRYAHVLTAALSLDTARPVLRYGQQFFKSRNVVKVMADQIIYPVGDSRWTITSRDHISSRGEHPSLIVFDELGWSADDELFASLLAGQASVPDPLMLVISTVGKRAAGPLWKVKELAESGDPAVYFYYSTENRSPKVTPEFLERQRRILLPQQYAREHENCWTSGADAFTSVTDVDVAMGRGWCEQITGAPGREYVITVDLGAVHDPSVIGIGHEQDGQIVVDAIKTFQGSRESPVLLPVVEAALHEFATRFPPSTIKIETWQGMSMAQQLRGKGLPISLSTPTAKSNSDEWSVLAQRLASHTLIVPPHPRLREELLNLTLEVGPTGIKVSDKGRIHQDHAVVVRMLCAAFARPPHIPLRLLGVDEVAGKTPDEIAKDEAQRAAEATRRSGEEIQQAIKTTGAWFPGDPLPGRERHWSEPDDLANMIWPHVRR